MVHFFGDCRGHVDRNRVSHRLRLGQLQKHDCIQHRVATAQEMMVVKTVVFRRVLAHNWCFPHRCHGKSTRLLYLESVPRHELLHDVQAGGHAFWAVGLHAPHPLELHNVPTLATASNEKCLHINSTCSELHCTCRAHFQSSLTMHVYEHMCILMLQHCVMTGHDEGDDDYEMWLS